MELDLADERDTLIERYPNLHLVDSTAGPCLTGSISIEQNSQELDRFAVEISLGDLREGALPPVREVGGRLPWLSDRHVNSDGTCCVCLPEDYYCTHPGPFRLLDFLDGPVRSYFIGQALVERGDPWPYGEWRHGVEGVAQWFEDFNKSLNADTRKAYGVLLRLKEPPKGHHLCPCGSGEHLRDCHSAFVRRLWLWAKPQRNSKRSPLSPASSP